MATTRGGVELVDQPVASTAGPKFPSGAGPARCAFYRCRNLRAGEARTWVSGIRGPGRRTFDHGARWMAFRQAKHQVSLLVGQDLRQVPDSRVLRNEPKEHARLRPLGREALAGGCAE